MSEKVFRKGEYKETFEKVRDCINEGMGMQEIMEITNLSAEQINKIQDKIKTKKEKEYNDFIV